MCEHLWSKNFPIIFYWITFNLHSQDFNQDRIFLHDLFPWGLCSWPKCLPIVLPTVLPTSLPTVLRLFVEFAPSANGNEKRSGSVSVSEDNKTLQDSTSDGVRNPPHPPPPPQENRWEKEKVMHGICDLLYVKHSTYHGLQTYTQYKRLTA